MDYKNYVCSLADCFLSPKDKTMDTILALNLVCKKFHENIERNILVPTLSFSKKFHLNDEDLETYIQSDNRRRYVIVKKGRGSMVSRTYIVDMLTDVIILANTKKTLT